MLSLFPNLLAYQQLAPFLLRLTLGIVFLFWAYRKYRSTRTSKNITLAIVEALVGILLIIGLYTQLAALVSAIILVAHLVKKIKNKSFFTDGINYYFILLIISLSLLMVGSGAFSFDLPL